MSVLRLPAFLAGTDPGPPVLDACLDQTNMAAWAGGDASIRFLFEATKSVAHGRALKAGGRSVAGGC